MKFKGIVIGLLAAILAVNTIMAGLLVTEAKKQTEIERRIAHLIYWNEQYKNGELPLEGWKDITSSLIDNPYLISRDKK